MCVCVSVRNLNLGTGATAPKSRPSSRAASLLIKRTRQKSGHLPQVDRYRRALGRIANLGQDGEFDPAQARGAQAAQGRRGLPPRLE